MFPDWYKKAEKLYNEGIPYYKIANEIGINRKTVSYYLQKGGHTSNKKYVRIADNSKLRKYDLDEDIFNNIDTEEKAYWLGFLYADGNVSDRNNSIELGLKESDYEHIEKFKSFLKTNRPIYKKVKRVGKKEYVGYRLFITSEKIKTDLISKGCVPKKSLTIKFPSSDIVPDNLIHHFIRGYFDGDGCITKNNKLVSVELLGTEDFIRSYIKWTGLHENKVASFKHSEVKRVLYAGSYAMHIMDKLYSDANIYLNRKYDLYTSYKSPSA